MNNIIELSPNKHKIPDEVILPASKSISNRVLIINALSYSSYEIENLSESDDTQILAKILNSNQNHFDVGAAGTTMRFLTALLAKTVGEWQITGSQRMKQRPIKILVDAINQLGGRISYLENEGFPPLKIFGCGLKGGEIELDGGISSQYISALMMIAPYMIKGLKIKLVGNVISTPYIEMTKSIMEEYGVKVNFQHNEISILPQTYQPIEYRVESDWSAASYWYEILALVKKGTIHLPYLKNNSLQGDRAIADIFKHLGVETTFTEQGARLQYNSSLSFKGNDVFYYDFTDTPDLAQTVVVTACLLDIPFCFSGLQSLRIKETNRILALSNELKKLGFVLKEKDNDKLLWNGDRCDAEKQPIIKTYEDHRMAMAFAPVGLIVPIKIANPEVVSKSYPRFWSDFARL